MRKLILTLSLILGALAPLHSSHIVGGEFEMIHLEGFTYRINLIMYFDEVNGAPPILENELQIFQGKSSLK